MRSVSSCFMQFLRDPRSSASFFVNRILFNLLHIFKAVNCKQGNKQVVYMVSRQRLWQKQNPKKKKKHDEAYEAKHKTVSFRLNLEEDRELIEYIENQPKKTGERKQDFFKRVLAIAKAADSANFQKK